MKTRPGEGSVADPQWELLARVAAGDVDAFGPIVEAHQDRLVSLCHRLLGDVEEARDAAQEVFLKAFRHAAEFEPRGLVGTWLYRIAVNHCFNRLRRRRIARFFPIGSGGGDEGERPALDPPAGGADAEAALLARERWRRTRKAIDALPPSQRAVLVLAKFEGMSYREIAATLEITEGAVESRLVRAMRRLAAADLAQEIRPPRVS